ncbi:MULTISPECIES: NfeD family protein [Gallibacterium]|nr:MULTISPECIES: NfeD family protein [Gallibacterium]
MMEWLAQWGAIHWLVLGFVLLILEIVVPGIFFLWWGIAALVLAILSYFFLLSLVIGGILFAAIAVLASLCWWKIQSKRNQQDIAAEMLNQRGLAMLGQQGVITEVFTDHIARAKFGDGSWRVEGNQLHQGDVVEVVSIKGITLVVKVIKN